jgi:glycosyltransferase involved in cell wall biosynthesis
VRAAGFAGHVARVPHPAWPDPGIEPAHVEGDPLIGAFGNLNQSKRVPQLLEAFARLRVEHPGARLLLVGATSPGFDLERRLQRLGLEGDGIVREGYVDERRLWSLMSACDVHVSLRSPTMGETSGTAVRALVLGKPLVVSGVGWFAELPGDVALKVPVGDHEVADLAAALRLLEERVDVREARGGAARALARSEHDLAHVAVLQAAAFERVAGGDTVAEEVLREVSDAAASVGIGPGSPEASEIARRLSELGG